MAPILKEYLVSFGKTGAICPSSPRLAEAMTNNGKLSSSQCVVELGPGSGAITKKILAKIPQRCTFFALEINPVFAKKIEEDYGPIVYLDSAEKIQKYLRKHNARRCDTVISSLPWSFFDQRMQRQIFGSVYRSLAADGKMVTYSYLHGLIFPSGKRFQKILLQHFPKVKKKIIWKNLPPAVVYECRK